MTKIPRFKAWAARSAALALAGALLGGCASGPNANPADPLEPYNRSMTRFNDNLDKAVLKPVATAYRDVTPQPVRTGVGNFFSNLGDAWSFANNLLQLRGREAFDSMVRFSVNSVLGLGGVLDVAEEAGLERFTSEDLGQTLGFWGIKSGPYLVIPFIGPSNLRDSAAWLLEINDSPVGRIWQEPRDHNPAMALQLLNTRANLLNAGRVFDEIALDKYVLLRDAYLSRRRSQIYDGEPPEDEANSPAAFKKQLAPR